jgi:hypothetical protein
VDQLGPERVLPGQLVAAIAEQRLDLRAEVRARVVGPVRVDVGDDRRLLDERSVALLGLPEPFERCRALGRLGHHALPVERRAVLVTDQHGLVVDPHDASVLGEHPVVGGVGRARRHDRLEGRPHRRHVVRVEAVHPTCGIGQPLLDGVPEDPFDRRADVEERAGSVDLGIRVLDVDDPGEVPDQRP